MPVKNAPNTREESSDAYYSEEMSRAAVGRLFANDDEDDEDESSQPIKSTFVTGFEREVRDSNPTKKRGIVHELNGRVKRPPQEEQPEPAPPKEEQDEVPVERHRRREHATTRLLSNNGDEPERERSRGRRNPAPKPAVRVNVQRERNVQENPDEPRKIKRTEAQPEDLDAFRRRYNSGELVSPPRNPNRPVRPGRSDVRSNRMRVDRSEIETVSPVRWIMSGAAILVLVVVIIVVMSMVSTRNNYNAANDRIIELEQQLSAARRYQRDYESVRLDLDNARTTIAELNEMINRQTTDSSGLSTSTNGGGRPGGDTHPSTGDPIIPTPTLPATHVIQRGDDLATIARLFFGNADSATIEHIRSTNNIANANLIRQGDTLTLVPMP